MQHLQSVEFDRGRHWRAGLPGLNREAKTLLKPSFLPSPFPHASFLKTPHIETPLAWRGVGSYSVVSDKDTLRSKSYLL